ncbi:MAG: hypothetical protein WBW46_13460, partial [Candidatus Sulfotelmatobacter sp.]
TDQQPQQARARGKAVLGARGGDTDAIVSTVDIFVGDYYFFFDLGDDRLHRLEVGMQRISDDVSGGTCFGRD